MTRASSSDQAMTRRSLLGSGAVLSAGLIVPKWSWAGTQSVLGLGGTTSVPWQVWDDEADTVIANVIGRGELASVNAILRYWKTNGQALPAGLPADLHAFIERARQLPSWADTSKLVAAVDFNKKRGTYLGVAYGFVSGMMSTVIPHEARAVFYSKGGADMKRRISRTAKFGYDIGSLNAFHDPAGEMIVTAVKTRMAHAGVRYWLPRSASWKRSADQHKPISQRDILVTWHSLPTSVMRSMRKWGVDIPAAEADAFLHSWQVAAHMLGVRDEYIPKDWEAANLQAPEILDPVLAPTAEGIKLADILLDLASEGDRGLVMRPMLESLTRSFLGDKIADWLKIPRHFLQDEIVDNGWPEYVRMKEAGLAVPESEEAYWVFDEVARQAVLWYLAEGQEIWIDIPDMNNPSYS